MRKSLLFFSLLAALLIVSGCTHTDNGDVEYIAVHSSEDNEWMLIDAHGNTIGERFSQKPSVVVNGFYTVATDEGIEIRRSGSSAPFAPDLGPSLSAGVMNDDRIPVSLPNERILLLNSNGDSIATLMPVDGNEIDAVAPFFSSGRMIVRVADGSKSGLYGAINTDGAIVVDPIYDMLFPFHGDYALAVLNSNDENRSLTTESTAVYSLIDRNGRTVATLPEGMTPLTDGVYREVIPVTNADDQPGFFNIQGKFRSAPENVDRIVDATDNCYVYINSNNMRGVMAVDGYSILDPIFTQIFIVDDEHFIVNNDEMECPMLVDRKTKSLFEFTGSKEMVDLPYHFPFSLNVKFIGKTDDDTYIIYSNTGNALSTETFDKISTQMVLNPLPGVFSDMIGSDYFDLAGAANLLTDPLSSSGYGNASLNKTVKSLTTAPPENLTSTTSVEYISSKGDRLTLTATAYTAAPITTAIPIYKEKSTRFFGFWSFLEPDELLRTDYEYNPNATVDKIVVKLSTESTSYTATRPKIDSRIKEVGFTPFQTTEAFTIYHNGGENFLLLMPMAEQKGTAIYMMTDKIYQSSISALRREAEINYAQK